MRQDDIGFLVKSINHKLEKRVNLLLRRYGLTLTQMRVLFFLHDRAGQKTTQRDIEEYFGVSHPTVIGVIRRLESKGFVGILTDSEDRRYNNICLIEGSPFAAFLTELPPEQLEPMLTRGLSGEEIRALKRCLAIVSQNIQEEL